MPSHPFLLNPWLVLSCCLGLSIGSLPGQSTNAWPATNAPAPKSKASQKSDSEKFENLVRADFLAGLAGDQNAFGRAMKLCADTLQRDPKHTQAMVWHGAGLIFLSSQAFAVRDFPKGSDFWQRGMTEMDGAVALEPDNASVLMPRGTTLLGASKHMPDPVQSKALLKIGVADYEKVLRLQKAHFKDLPLDARGELLFGLADGWHRLHNTSRARQYFQRVVDECAGSAYAEQAKVWLEYKDPNTLPDTPSTSACIGCHGK